MNREELKRLEFAEAFKEFDKVRWQSEVQGGSSGREQAFDIRICALIWELYTMAEFLQIL